MWLSASYLVFVPNLTFMFDMSVVTLCGVHAQFNLFNLGIVASNTI
jgi:hypothetical protein